MLFKVIFIETRNAEKLQCSMISTTLSNDCRSLIISYSISCSYRSESNGHLMTEDRLRF